MDLNICFYRSIIYTKFFNKEKNSDIYKLLSIYDVVDNNGNNDGILTSQELKAVKKLQKVKDLKT